MEEERGMKDRYGTPTSWEHPQELTKAKVYSRLNPCRS